MKIEIASLDSIYERLKNPVRNPQEQFFVEATKQLQEGEFWREEPSPVNIVNITLYGKRAPLPKPLNSARLKLDRKGEVYSAELFLWSKKVLPGISNKLKEILKDNRCPTGTDGAGYFLYDSKPSIAVTFVDGYELVLGEGGAVQRKFGTLEEFVTDLTNLEKATNIFVNSAIDLYIEKEKIGKNPDLLVYLSC